MRSRYALPRATPLSLLAQREVSPPHGRTATALPRKKRHFVHKVRDRAALATRSDFRVPASLGIRGVHGGNETEIQLSREALAVVPCMGWGLILHIRLEGHSDW